MHFSFDEEIKKYPFVRLTIPYIVGIITALSFSTNLSYIFIVLSLVLLVFIIIHLNKNFRLRIFSGLLINIAFILLAYLNTSITLSSAENHSLTDYQGQIIGKVASDPSFREKSVRLNVDIVAIKQNEEWYKTSGRTMLYLSIDERVNHIRGGRYIIFSPQLSEIQNRGNPEEFDYKRYLAFNMIHTSDFLNSEEWDFLGEKQDDNFRFKILNFRQKLISLLENHGLEEDELAVISALALGYRDRISDEIRHNYASSGAMHILAVSGLHVGIIYMIIVNILKFIKSKKMIVLKVVLTICLIWFYATLTGLSPSVSRAATMFSFIAAGALFKRSAGVFNSIAASAFILLFINPLNITQIGFQLSYAAVIGIVIIFPKVYNLLKFNNWLLDKIWALTVVSFAAQIATAPIAIYYFNQFSNYFLLTNYLLIPLATVSIYLTIAVFLFSGFSGIASFFTYLLSKSVGLMNYFTAMIENLPGSVSTNLYFDSLQLLFLYLIIIFAGIFLFQSKYYKHLNLLLICIICFFTISLFRNYERLSQEYIIVYNIGRTSAINIIDGRDNVLFANFDNNNINRIEFSAKNNWLKLGLENEKFIDISQMTSRSLLTNIAIIDNRKIFQKNNFISFNGTRLLLLNSNFLNNKHYLTEKSEKLQLDYIILSDNVNIDLKNIANMFKFNKIIIDSSNNFRSINRWLNENKQLQLPLHNVVNDGAFVKKLK